MKTEFKIKDHSYPIADSGDYDNCYEITNGEISFFTNDDMESLDAVVDALNNSGCQFYLVPQFRQPTAEPNEGEIVKFINDWMWDSAQFGDERRSEQMDREMQHDVVKMISRFVSLRQSPPQPVVSEEEIIEFTNAMGYNYEYIGDGKWQAKDLGDPIVFVNEVTTKELYEAWMRDKLTKGETK